MLPVLEAGLADIVGDKHYICHGVLVEPAHGHTAGHSMLSLHSHGADAMFVGDAFHHALEVKHPELDMGACEDFAIGLATHSAKDGLLWHNGTRMTWWDKADAIPEDKNDNGFNGTALIVNPNDFQSFTKTENDNIALITVTPGKPFTYYAGACWSNGPDFHSATQWNHYIETLTPHF